MIIIDRRTGKAVEVGGSNQHKRVRKMQRRVFVWSEVMNGWQERTNTSTSLRLVTLTYRPGVEWSPNHIRDFMRLMRRRMGEDCYAYAWVTELQKRGAVHYHVYFVLRLGYKIDPFPDAENGGWPYGSSNITDGRSAFYLATYVSKEYQKFSDQFPKGMRMYAVWFDEKELSEYELWRLKLSVFPRWLEEVLLEDKGYFCPNLPEREITGGGFYKITVGSKVKRIQNPFVLASLSDEGLTTLEEYERRYYSGFLLNQGGTRPGFTEPGLPEGHKINETKSLE